LYMRLDHLNILLFSHSIRDLYESIVRLCDTPQRAHSGPEHKHFITTFSRYLIDPNTPPNDQIMPDVYIPITNQSKDQLVTMRHVCTSFLATGYSHVAYLQLKTENRNKRRRESRQQSNMSKKQKPPEADLTSRRTGHHAAADPTEATLPLSTPSLTYEVSHNDVIECAP